MEKNENDYKELIKAYDKLCSETREKYELEKCLKNEAYAFILSEGLLDKFKAFQNDLSNRNDTEKAISYLVANTSPEGEWIG